MFHERLGASVIRGSLALFRESRRSRPRPFLGLSSLLKCRLNCMPRLPGSTTVRVSRRTHQLLSDLAAQQGRSVSDLLDHLAEQARRQQIIKQYDQRMTELLNDPAERAALEDERAWLEAASGATLTEEPAYPRGNL